MCCAVLIMIIFFFSWFYISNDSDQYESKEKGRILFIDDNKMGKVLSKIMKKLSADGPKRILMLGLDNAGRLF